MVRSGQRVYTSSEKNIFLDWGGTQVLIFYITNLGRTSHKQRTEGLSLSYKGRGTQL